MAPRRRASKTTITSLPTELVTFIVALSAPPPDWTPARSAHLRSLALVSRSFRGPAQQELFRHVVLPTVAAARLYVAVLKSRTGAHFAASAKSLRAGTVSGKESFMDGEVDEEKFGLPYITKRCLRLEQMFLVEIGPLDVELAAGPVLKELHCRSCRFMPSLLRKKRRPPTLAITRLTLSHCDYASFIRAGSLPHLRSLSFTSDPVGINVSWADLARLPPYYGPVTALAHQLTSLCLDAVTTEYLCEHSHLFTNLVAHDSRFLWTTDTLPFFAGLPNQLRHLRVAPASDAEDAGALLDDTVSIHALAFVHKHLQDLSYDSLKDLEHLRLTGACAFRRLFVRQLLEMGSRVKLSFDDDRDGSEIYDGARVSPSTRTRQEDMSLDDKFNPEFWRFVDDVEEAEEEVRKRGEGEL